MATKPSGVVAPYRRLSRTAKDWQPRVSAIEIVGDGNEWRLLLGDRATYLELTLLRLAYSVETTREDKRGMVLTPRAGQPCPTREELAATLTALHDKRLKRGH